MKILMLLLALLPIGCFGANGLEMHNINDGYHALKVKNNFFAYEQLTATKNEDQIKAIVCTATDSAKLQPVMVIWKVTINNYHWHYTLEDHLLMTNLLFPSGNPLFRIEIDASIDSASYKGIYGYIRCFTTG